MTLLKIDVENKSHSLTEYIVCNSCNGILNIIELYGIYVYVIGNHLKILENLGKIKTIQSIHILENLKQFNRMSDCGDGECENGN